MTIVFPLPAHSFPIIGEVQSAAELVAVVKRVHVERYALAEHDLGADDRYVAVVPVDDDPREA